MFKIDKKQKSGVYLDSQKDAPRIYDTAVQTKKWKQSRLLKFWTKVSINFLSKLNAFLLLYKINFSLEKTSYFILQAIAW